MLTRDKVIQICNKYLGSKKGMSFALAEHASNAALEDAAAIVDELAKAIRALKTPEDPEPLAESVLLFNSKDSRSLPAVDQKNRVPDQLR